MGPIDLGDLPNTLAASAMDYAISHADVAHGLLLLGVVFSVATLYTKTMVPLRIVAIASNIFFLGYGYFSRSLLTFSLYLAMLPINCFRLGQMLRLVKRVKAAADGDLSLDWLKPFMKKRKYRAGDVLFRKGERAYEMFFLVRGKYRIPEIGVELRGGNLVGEMGMLAPNNQRTQSFECVEDGEVLVITYDKVLELYFQNPNFGYYFLRLTTDRLLQNIARLEAVIERNGLKVDQESTRARQGTPEPATGD
jgi:hypothetical protein